MIEFFAQYGLFLAKTVTFLIAAFVLMAMATSFSRRGSGEGTLQIEKLNDRYNQMRDKLAHAVSNKAAAKVLKKERKARDKAQSAQSGARARTFLIDFKGDMKASAVASLREEISAVLSVINDGDDVLVRLENPGGVVHEHGLAAAQLARVRDRQIPLTIAVDKVAASGGYLMACVGNKIITAPFAIVGSIGVIAQLPNFNRLLEDHGVDVEQITAGKHKRSVTMFGKNTDADRAKLKEELEDVHRLFKDVVHRYRPTLDIEPVATGEHWYGSQAIELGLVDELMTSDELLIAALEERDIFKVSFEIKQPLQKKLMGAVDSKLNAVVRRALERLRDMRLGA